MVANAPMYPDLESVPYRGTAPWGEHPIYDEPEQPIIPAHTPIVSPSDEDRQLHKDINLAFGTLALQLDYHGGNDDQYGYPPPGAPNVQPFQSGHTSITVHNQSAEQGWGTDPAFKWPRYPHMENKFPGYNANGVFRRNGQWIQGALLHPRQKYMQHQRDMQLRHAIMHRMHGVIVTDAPSVTHTYNVVPIDPTGQEPFAIGVEGVLPG
jgi:hypothetical protein